MLIFFFPLTLKDLKKNQDLKSHVNSIRGVIYIKNLLNLSNDKGLLPFFFFLIYMLTILRIDITDEKIYHSWEVTFIYNILEKTIFLSVS